MAKIDIMNLSKDEQLGLAEEIGRNVNEELLSVKTKLDEYLKKYGLGVKIGFEYTDITEE